MSTDTRQRFRISEEAALWLIRLEEDGSPECRAQFAAWARQSPWHVEEFLFAQATSQHLSGVDPERRIDLSALDEAAAENTVVPLSKIAATDLPSPLPSKDGERVRVKWGLLSSIAASIAVALIAWTFFQSRANTYATNIGDQQAVKLPDGSVMHLNSGSHAEIHFSGQAREVRLLDGEALFVVEHDPTRPFRVATDGATIQALGTQFNVYRRDGSTRVSVLEGAVQVSSQAQPDVKALKLVAGDQADITQGQVVRAAKPNVERAVAWRSRRLVFEADPLEEVAREFNRYDVRHPLRLEGEAIRGRVVSGVFDADDAQPLIEFLEADPALSVTRTEKEIVIRAR